MTEHHIWCIVIFKSADEKEGESQGKASTSFVWICWNVNPQANSQESASEIIQEDTPDSPEGKVITRSQSKPRLIGEILKAESDNDGNEVESIPELVPEEEDDEKVIVIGNNQYSLRDLYLKMTYADPKIFVNQRQVHLRTWKYG